MVAAVRPLTGAVDVASSSLGVGPGSTGGRRWTGEMRDFMRSSRRVKWRGIVFCLRKRRGCPFTTSLAYTAREAQRALHAQGALLSAALLSWPELSFQGPRQGCVDRFQERSRLLVPYQAASS